MARKKKPVQPHLEDRSALVASLPLGRALSEDLLDLALTHRSFSYENGEVPHNERLEFLGDAVLGLAAAQYLYTHFPESPQGVLSRRRAAVVNTRALSHLARQLHLGPYIKLGKGEAATGGRDRSSILEDVMESIIGAVYLDHGPLEAHKFVLRLLEPIITNDEFLRAEFDYKTKLQEIAAEHEAVPSYEAEELPTEPVSYRVKVRVGDMLTGTGEGSSKKNAEREAAMHAVTTYYAARGETLNLFED